MYYQEFYYWCRDAVKKIKYTPDRKKVYAELYSHMQDRYDALIERGCTPAEAEEKTLQAMGSAEELAPQLAAIHRPFWGYTLTLTRLIATAMIFLALGHGVYYFHEQAMENQQNENEYIFAQGLQGDGAYIQICHTQPDVKASTDGYTFCVTDAEVWRSLLPEEVEDKDYHDRLFLRLEVKNLLPWAPEQRAFEAMWAIDSAGVYHDTIIRETQPPEMGYIGMIKKQKMWNTYTYDLYFSDTTEDVQWVELHYDRDGRELCLRVDLTGGNEA